MRSIQTRRWTAILLAAILLLQCLPAAALPADSDGVLAASAGEYGVVKPYVFHWGDDDLPRDAEAICYYADTFFDGPATAYSPSLATASACLAMASGASIELGTPVDYTKQDKNGVEFLTLLGFTNPQSNADFKVKPKLDSIGCVAGYKVIDGTPLIALGVRGCNYMAEWGGNFTIGTEPGSDHKGFNEAADKAVAFLTSYIQSDPFLSAYTGSVKVWVAGYSRAGATSNLTAAKLVRAGSVGGKTLPKENIYAYCFETPSGGLLDNRVDGRDYNNIFNILNAHDMVPMVAPAAYGFAQYGVKKILPTRETDAYYSAKRNHMLSRYERAGKYSLDDFVSYKFQFGWPVVVPDKNGVTSQAVFMDGFINHLAKGVIGDRDQFAAQLQDPLRRVVDLLMGEGNMTSANAWKLIKRVGYNFLGMELLRLIDAWNNGTWNDVAVVIIRVVQKSANELGLRFDVDKLVRQSGPEVLKLLIKLFISAPNWTITLVKDSAGRGGILQAHSLLLAKTWLECMDPCYVPNDAERLDPDDVFLSGEYRLVRIASDQKKGLKIETFINDRRSGAPAATLDEDAQSGDVTMAFSAQKEYAIYLPTNADCTVRITGNANGKVQYSVSEYNPTLEPSAANERIKRICYWNEVPLGKDAVLTGILPTFTQGEIRDGAIGGSTCVYTLNGAGGSIAHTGDKKGTALNSAYHTVTVAEAPQDAISASDENAAVYGFTWGAGTYLVGTNAGVHAMPASGGRFVGWYENGVCIGTETEYAYPVLQTMIGTTHALTAQFACNLTPQNAAAENVENGIRLTWADCAAAPMLLSRIAGYKVYRDGALLQTVPGNAVKSFTDTSIAAGATYTYTVSAYDNYTYTDPAWGESPQSDAVTIKAGGPVIADGTLPDGAENAAYTATLTAAGETPIVWSLAEGALPAGLSLAQDGAIRGTPAQAGVYTFTVQAANRYGTDTATFSIAVRSLANRPVIATTETPNGSLGGAYDVQLRALGEPAPTWRISAGSLPPGLSMGADGRIAGTASAAGAYAFTVTAENEFGADTRDLCIVICYVNGAPVIATPKLPGGCVKDAYDAQLAFFGLEPVYWTLGDGTLPPGLTLSEATGRISGTPTAAGSYTFTVQLDNVIGTDARTFTVRIESAGGGEAHGAAETTYTPNAYTWRQAGAWQADGSLRFAVNAADCGKFASVSVDGRQLEKDEYTLYCDGVAVSPDYLATLADGAHTLCLRFTDGMLETTFVTPQTHGAETTVMEVPATGGTGYLLLALAVIWSAALLLRRRGCR